MREEVAGYAGIDPALLLMVETYLASIRIPRLNDQLAALLGAGPLDELTGSLLWSVVTQSAAVSCRGWRGRR